MASLFVRAVSLLLYAVGGGAGAGVGAALARHHDIALAVGSGIGTALGLWTQAALLWLFVDIRDAVTAAR